MASVSDYFGCKQPAQRFGRKTNSGILVGIEVELEQVQLLAEPKGWKAIKDGSLKDNGLEFTIPVWSANAEAYLTDLFASLKNPNANSRCSVHIHADVTTFTVDQVRSLIILYTIFERALYRYSGKRWNNIYCVPIQTWFIGMNISEWNFGDMAIGFKKYSGLNVFPDEGKLGTVEFRHMAGNKNPMYIASWINTIAKLVKYAETQNYTQLLERVRDMRATSQYWDLFKEIFGEYCQALNYSTFDKDVEEGITFVKLITE